MFIGKLKKQNGKLIYPKAVDSSKYQIFLNKLNEGDEVDIYLELATDDASLAQLAKVHSMIKDLSNFTGTPFMGMKLLVKKEAGLCFIKDQELICHSFGDCSKDQLSLAIQACIDLGLKVGLNLQ